jgi:hypothetical protein
MSDAPTPRFRLCDLHFFAKLGVTGLVLVLAGGLAAAAYHLKLHHENRDEVPGVSLNDIKGAYHGVEVRAPLLVSLESGHPETLKPEDRKVLTDWLTGGKISTDYDNLDLGDRAPAEIIGRDCVSCHSEKAAATQPAAAKVPLDSFEKIKNIAFTKKIDPPPWRILILSTHTHALAMGTMSLVVAGLLLATRLPRALTGLLIMAFGVALAVDIGAWFQARQHVEWVYAIIVGGGVYNGASALSLVAIVLDMWFPRVRR